MKVRVTHGNYTGNLETRSRQYKLIKKLYLCLTKHHAMQTYWGAEV
jgi:hypothetical protein